MNGKSMKRGFLYDFFFCVRSKGEMKKYISCKGWNLVFKFLFLRFFVFLTFLRNKFFFHNKIFHPFETFSIPHRKYSLSLALAHQLPAGEDYRPPHTIQTQTQCFFYRMLRDKNTFSLFITKFDPHTMERREEKFIGKNLFFSLAAQKK